MKPIVSSMQAWSCTVISFFAIIILSVLALLYRSNHEQLMGSTNDPTDGKAVSRTVFTAVFVYIVRLLLSTLRTGWLKNVSGFLLILLRDSLCFAVYRACSTSERIEGARFLCESRADHYDERAAAAAANGRFFWKSFLFFGHSMFASGLMRVLFFSFPTGGRLHWGDGCTVRG
ncbi:hypothetical protein H0G86_007951 [Trichoderma simmonsii]|uniref:Uncharacterized protein n=1 Tax=Trichoderma simmonsii TaxID=1491479 RepID=A0A8G0LHJ5_9HYPO|nr:hypothetical protein H0G86_007951 [Trichoderma simmonsii]